MTEQCLKVLIVEDQFLIAKQVEMVVSAAGHQVVGIAGTFGEACQMAMATDPDVAFVDLSLADGVTGEAVGQFIKETCQTQIVYTTANVRRLPTDLSGALGVIEKPFTKGGLVAALVYIAAIIRNRRLPDTVPSSLRLAPL